MAAINPFIHRMPAQLQREYEVDLGIEATKNAIVFNKDNNGGYNILCRHHMFVVYLKKPSIN